MIGNDWIESTIEDDIHRFDSHRVTITFEDVIDAFGRAVFPAIDLPVIAGFVKTVGMQFIELIHIVGIAYDMVVSLFSGRRVEIADDKIPFDSEMKARADQFAEAIVFFIKAMMRPAQMNIGDMQQSEPWNGDARHGDIARHVIVFAVIYGNISRKIVLHRIAAHDGCTFPPTIKSNVTPVLMNMVPKPRLT